MHRHALFFALCALFYVREAQAQSDPSHGALPARVPLTGPAVSGHSDGAASGPVPGSPVSQAQLDPRLLPGYELQQIDSQLYLLRAQRPRLFWPMSMVIVGGGMAVGVGAVALLVWSTSRDRRYGWDEQGNRYEHTHVDWGSGNKEYAGASIFYGAVGLALLGGGLAMLVPRIKARREINRQARPLQQRRLELLRSLGYGVDIGRERTAIAARVAF
jgi:hypothetical protein